MRYDTPGVYDERRDASAGGIAALRTDVAGFVGIADRGPLRLAVPVESARQFEAWFGRPVEQGYLAYSARAFFENGGRRLWAARVASPAASAAFLTVDDTAQPAWRIDASSAGSWGNAIAVRLLERRRVQRRGRVDALVTNLLHVDNASGLGAWTLVEVRAATTRERAVVRRADPASGRLELDRPLALMAVNTALQIDSIAYTLDVFEAGRLVAQIEDLSIVPEHPRYGPAVLKQPWVEIDPLRPDEWTGRAPERDLAVEYFRVARNRGSIAPPVVVVHELRNDAARQPLNLLIGTSPGAAAPLAGGADGLATLDVTAFYDGLGAIQEVDEVSLVAVPDIHIQPRPANPVLPPPPCVPDPCLPSAPVLAVPQVGVAAEMPPRFPLDQIAMVQAAMVNQCEHLRDRVALLDAPFQACSRLTFAATELREWRMRFDTKFAALYAPWALVVDPLRGGGRAAPGLTRAIPPSGHVAGQCAATDLRAGVHVAPANAPLAWIQGVTLTINDALHGLLNTMGVNVLRAQPGRGLRILGARTVSSDSDWRFLNVRRLMSMIEEAIDVSLQWAVFEPNDWQTRAKLTLVVQSFLLELWSRGAMVGASPKEAFWVRCDETNNGADGRSRGWLVIDIGIAPTVPFEFIVLRIGRDANGFMLTEGEPALAAG
ncbi:MAG TPA: phage tail sheath C-terminal domain-containing protein [Vicinamibacterales bacterium]